jgi:hypothetical protein
MHRAAVCQSACSPAPNRSWVSPRTVDLSDDPVNRLARDYCRLERTPGSFPPATDG